MGPVAKLIACKLQAAFSPASLEIIDESSHHHGHSGAHAQGESHFRVRIAADAFFGKTRLEKHRMVNAVLDLELKTRVHALAIEVI